MGKPLKRSRKVDEHNESETESEPELNSSDAMENGISPDEYDDFDENDDYSVEGSDEMDEDDEDEVKDEDDEDASESEEKQEQEEEKQKDAELAQLEKEISLLQHEEQDILKNLKQHKDEDLQKGQAVKNQKALWDKVLEFRFLLQKAFSSCNSLPQEPIRSSFCSVDSRVSDAYSDLITSSTKTLDSILQLQEALLEKNPTITQSTEANSVKQSNHLLDTSGNSSKEGDEEWVKICQMHSRMSSFRDKSVDKWHRKTQVTTGNAAIRGKLNAFNQDISEQVAAYMRDPSKMIKGMRMNRSAIALFGNVLESTGNFGTEGESVNGDGDPELLDDSGFYQYLLKEFFETIDPTSSEKAFYALKRLQTKKRKIVDRRASKSRKIRYNIHEKIVNFMAPEPMNIPPMAPKLFENLFNLKSSRPTSVQ